MADLGVKIGVSGVSQFKQGMKESQAAVKSLDAQLKLNEATLKANGDQEAYLQTKTELLNRQIEEQKKVVDQAASALEAMNNNGVSKTSTAFQNMQTQLYKAQTDLANMENSLNGIEDSGEGAQEGVSHMNQALQRVGANVSFESVTEGLEKITGTLERAATAAWNLGKKIVQATLGGASWADELATEASVWEIPAEDLYRMRETARIIDTDAETILSARDKMKKGREEGGKEFMGALAYLKINPSGMNDVDLFWKAGEAIAALGKEEDKVHYAQTLFGKSWRELIPLFSAGREEYEKVFNTWDWIGDEQLEKLTTLDDKYQELQSEWEAVQLQFQAQMAEVLTPVMETLTGLLKEFNTYLQSENGQQMLASLGEAISGLFEDITTIDPAEIIGKITTAVNGLKEGFEWIKTNKESIVKAIEAIGIAFGLLKLAGLAANIGRIVTGLRGLTGGGAAGASGTTATSNATALAGTAGSGSALLGAAGLTAIIAGFEWAKDMRINHADLVRGTNENLEAQSTGVETELVNYLNAMKAQSELTWLESEAEVAAIVAKVEESRNALLSKEGGQQALDAYSDWRQQHSYGNEYWEVPENLNRMTEVAGEMSGEVTVMRGANENMTAAANGLMGMPAEMYTNVYNAIVAGMSGVQIIVDAGCVDTIGERISYGMGRQVVEEIQ